jgi:hypothetical protein
VDAPFYHWLASLPDRHPFPHCSAQVSFGPSFSYLSSKPFVHSVFITLMEAVCTSETLVYSKTTHHYVPEGSHFNIRCFENLKSDIEVPSLLASTFMVFLCPSRQMLEFYLKMLNHFAPHLAFTAV